MHKEICRATVAFVVSSLLGWTAAVGAPVEKVKIGFLTTMSGPESTYGKAHLEGFELALELAGGKIGGIPAEVIVADDKFNPEIGVQAAQKLLNTNKVDFVTGVIWSNVMMAVYKPIIESKTFFVSSFVGPSPLSGESCSPFLFGAGMQNDTTYEAVGKYVSEQPKIKNVFILAANYQAGKDAVAGFKRYFKGNVVGEIYTRLNQPDYSGEISQIRSAKPDAVYAFYPGTMGITFVRQLGAAHLGIPMYSGFTILELSVHAMGEAAEGSYSAAVYNADLDNPANRIFVDAYKKKYNRNPEVYAALGYDVVAILDAAVRSVKGDLTQKDAIREALRNTKFNLARGPFQFNTNQMPIQNFYLVQAASSKGDIRLEYRGLINAAHRDSYASKCSMR